MIPKKKMICSIKLIIFFLKLKWKKKTEKKTIENIRIFSKRKLIKN